VDGYLDFLEATILACAVCSAHAVDKLVALALTLFEDAWLKEARVRDVYSHELAHAKHH
jgi:hypothetical protein